MERRLAERERQLEEKGRQEEKAGLDLVPGIRTIWTERRRNETQGRIKEQADGYSEAKESDTKTRKAAAVEIPSPQIQAEQDQSQDSRAALEKASTSILPRV
jgi:hypothetical protein